jgi:hypothetical protein
VTETVTVTQLVGNDSDGDPIAAEEPITLTPLEIAPGNMMIKYGTGGDLTDVEFTVYLPLRVNTGEGYTDTDTVVRTGDDIEVRGRRCTAMVSVWRSQRGGDRGGVAVLARSRSGKAA